MELWHPVAFGLVEPHSGPHALIATVIPTRPSWSTGEEESSDNLTETSQQ